MLKLSLTCVVALFLSVHLSEPPADDAIILYFLSHSLLLLQLIDLYSPAPSNDKNIYNTNNSTILRS
jgi:hypothetical protein